MSNRPASKIHLKNQRIWLEKYILTDLIADKILAEIRQGDVVDFIHRLNGNIGDNTLNKVIETLKVIIKEAYNRDDIDKDPMKGIGSRHYRRKKRVYLLPQSRPGFFPKTVLVLGRN